MPQDLVEKARANNCEQVSDFYKRPGLVGPPYAYLHVRGEEDEAAVVFWCQRLVGSSLQYILLVENRTKQSPFAECERTIESKNYPRGLSVRTEKAVTLDSFRSLKDPGKRGPKIQMNKPAIVSEYDGTSEIFYCHNGSWLVLTRH
jgi:hypothetical protein